MFSGGWRIKLISFNDPQLIWSDYGGCNVYESWLGIGEKIPYRYINTPEGAQMCKDEQKKVVSHMISHPIETAFISISKILRFVKASDYWQGMNGIYERPFWVYRYTLRYLLISFLIRSIILLVSIIKKPSLIMLEKNLIHSAVFLYFLFLSIPNNGIERARFLVSFSPFILIFIKWNSFYKVVSTPYNFIKSKMLNKGNSF